MNFAAAGAEARAYGKRGNMAANALARYRIEGEYVTLSDIAARTGKSAKETSKRMSKLRMASGPITWARLSA